MSAEMFKRALTTRYQEFRKAFDAAMAGFGSGADLNQKKNLIEDVYQRAGHLQEILAEGDRPVWLNAVFAVARNFSQNPHPQAANDFLQNSLRHFYAIGPIAAAEAISTDYNFDKAFDELRSKYELTELFDRLAAELLLIVESKRIDSNAVLSAINKMIAALKANRAGSYSSMLGTFSFVSFSWRYVLEWAQRVPGIKEGINAANKEIEAGKANMKQVEEDFQKQAQEKMRDDIARIRNVMESLPTLPAPAATTDNVIEGEFQKMEEPKKLTSENAP